jgi:hypothetical protein
VAVGDFNGDGKADLAVGHSGGVSVLLGNGDGTFSAPVTFGAGRFHVSVAVGDFDGDGKLDVAVFNRGNVWVLLGNGDGTFPAAAAFGAGYGPRSGTVGDFNGDGKPDLAVITIASTNPLPDAFAILINDTPATLSSLSLTPASVIGGTSSPTGTVTLTFPAPAGGATVELSSSDAAATPPASVTVPAGSTSVTFAVSTSPVTVSTPVTISASYSGGTRTASLTVLPPSLSSMTLMPTSVVGGPLGSSTATVTLNGPAPGGGVIVSLSSDNAAATVPASVTIRAGTSRAPFAVNTSVVVFSTTATISASHETGTRTANLRVRSAVPGL